MNEKLSYTEYLVVGSPRQYFDIGFEDYQEDKDMLKLTVDNKDVTEAGYSVVRNVGQTLEFTPAVPVGAVVRIQRVTDIDAPFYIFTAGNAFVPSNVDANFKQLLHAQQEVRDGFVKLQDDVVPLVVGLPEALKKAQDAAEAAQATRSADKVIDKSGVTQQDINDLWADMVYYAPMVGIKGGGTLSDSADFQRVIEESKKHHITLVLKHGEVYNLDKDMIVSDSKGLTLIGNGATLKLGTKLLTPNDNIQYSFSVVCVKGGGHTIDIQNVIQDGAQSFYDPWEYFVQGKRWYSVVGFEFAHAASVSYTDVTQRNIIGYGNRWFNCANVHVKNHLATEVGGHNGLHGNDSLGDCFYMGWREGDTFITLDNVVANGVEVEDKYSGGHYSPRSRIFLTVENLLMDTYKDTNTFINIKNCMVRKYQRGIHLELGKGNVTVTADNYDIRADCINLSAGVEGLSKFVGTNCTFKPYSKTYNGTAGANWGFDLYLGSGCIVDGVATTECLLAHHATSRTFLLEGSKVTNISGLLSNNGYFEGRGARFEYLEKYADYYQYAGKRPYLKNCTLVNKDSTVIKALSPYVTQLELDACTLINLVVNQSNYTGAKCKLDLNPALTGFSLLEYATAYADAYKSGVLYHVLDGVNLVDSTSTYTSTQDLTLAGTYSVYGKALGDAPASGWTDYIVRTTITVPSGVGALAGFLQEATNSITGTSLKRVRTTNGAWGSWA